MSPGVLVLFVGALVSFLFVSGRLRADHKSCVCVMRALSVRVYVAGPLADASACRFYLARVVHSYADCWRSFLRPLSVRRFLDTVHARIIYQ